MAQAEGQTVSRPGAKVETTSPSPAFSSNALRTFSVDVTTSTFGPAAASRPGFEAMERRLAQAGGTSLVGHGSGRILTFFGPAPPWLRALKPRCWETC